MTPFALSFTGLLECYGTLGVFGFLKVIGAAVIERFSKYKNNAAGSWGRACRVFIRQTLNHHQLACPRVFPKLGN